MKIDTSKIKGYEEMSLEEKLAVLETLEIEDNHEGYVKKDLFDKKASEVADLNRQLKARMSDEEKANAEKEKQFQEMQDRIAKYERNEKELDLTNRYLSQGYSSEMAKESAKAYLDGNLDKVFELQALHTNSIKQATTNELLKDTPLPSAVSTPTKVNKVEFSKMSYAEQAQLFNENRALYDEMSKGEN